VVADINLREKKKERIRTQIVEVAKAVFEEKGYDETNVSEIARLCDIGVGTVYNYFASKPELYVAVMSDLESTIEDVKFYEVALEADNLTDLVMNYVHKYLEPYIKMDQKTLFSLMKAMMSVKLPSGMVQGLLKLDQLVMGKLVKAFELRKKQGKLPANFDCLLHTENIYSIAGCEVLYSMFDDSRDMDTVYERVETKVRLYFSTKLED
jgi:AcrR family transcriptional regulator